MLDAQDIQVHVVKYHDRTNYMMRYMDPVTGQQHARSTGSSVRRTAERIAARWEAELRSGTFQKPANITWNDFRERYEDEKLSALSESMFSATGTAFNHLERVVRPKKLSSLTPQVMSRFQASLRGEGMSPSSMSTHFRHLNAAFSWAVAMGLLAKVPKVIANVRRKGQPHMRGRPVNYAEYQRMLSSVNAIRPHDAASWRRYLEGLWRSGLRLSESLVLTWDEEGGFRVDLSGKYPSFRILAEAEKGKRDRLLPLTPDFAEFLLRTPNDQRCGFVFPISGRDPGTQMTAKRVSRVVSSIGSAAGVIVDKRRGKSASAHDLRRSFGTRWAVKVKPAVLRALMRHESIETTMRYYVDQEAEDFAEILWNQAGQIPA